MDEWCADLAAILRAESVPQAVLVGHCLGANVALWFAHRHPGITGGLALIEPMFRQALAGPLGKAATLRPLFAPVVLGLRALGALGIHRRRLAVLDRTKESGALAEPLCLDVVAALAEGNRVMPLIGGRYGLSSKEFTPAMVKAVLDELKSPHSRNHFVVGIEDDVSHASLPYDP